MKRLLSVFLAVVLVVLSMTCLVSCAEDDGAQISVYLSDRIYGFDPAGDYSDDATIAVLSMLYEPLFTLNDAGKVKDALANDYSFDKETGDLYISLRESYWTNGDRVTAGDVVYAWQRILDPNFSTDAAPLLYDIKNARAIKFAEEVDGTGGVNALGAVAIDMSTLRITFENKDVDRDAFLRNLTNIALSPLNRNCIVGQELYWSNSTAAICYTNGPFMVQALDNAYGYFTLARNTGYHSPEGSNHAIDKYVLPDQIRTLWNIDPSMTDLEHLEKQYDAMLEKTVFYMSQLSLADRKEAKGDAVVSDAMSTYSYLFNTTNRYLDKAEVRVILSSVLDRNEIVNIATFGKAATGLIGDSVWNDTSSKDKYSFRKAGGDLIGSISIADAKAELDRLKASRGMLTITCLDREEDIAIAEYVAGVWNQLGYKVSVKPVRYETIYIDMIPGEEDKAISYRTSSLDYLYETRNFDVIALDWQMFSTNAFATLAAFSSQYNGQGVDLGAYNINGGDVKDYVIGNAAGYVSEAFDAAMASAYATSDLKARAEYLHEAERILMGDMPICPLMFNQNFYVVNSRSLKYLEVDYYGFTSFTDAKLKNYRDHFFKED